MRASSSSPGVDASSRRLPAARLGRIRSSSSRASARSSASPQAPLDHGDRILLSGIEIQVVELGQGAQPVGVDMHQRWPAGRRRMHPGDDERRRRHRTADAEALADAAASGWSCRRRGRR